MSVTEKEWEVDCESQTVTVAHHCLVHVTVDRTFDHYYNLNVECKALLVHRQSLFFEKAN